MAQSGLARSSPFACDTAGIDQVHCDPRNPTSTSIIGNEQDRIVLAYHDQTPFVTIFTAFTNSHQTYYLLQQLDKSDYNDNPISCRM
jgi:hypothetical protein